MDTQNDFKVGDRVQYLVIGTIDRLTAGPRAYLKDMIINGIESDCSDFNGEVDWVKLLYLKKVDPNEMI